MAKSKKSIFESFTLRLSKLIFRKPKPKHQEECQHDAEERNKMWCGFPVNSDEEFMKYIEPFTFQDCFGPITPEYIAELKERFLRKI